MRSGAPSVAALLCGLAAASAAADDVPKRTSASVSVTAIDFDVAATKGGRPVADLKPEDVILKVDGRRVPLDYLSRVDTGRPADPTRPLAATAGADAAIPRQILLAVDEDHIQPSERERAYAGAKAMLASLSPVDRVGAAVFENVRLHVLAPMGSSVESVASALDAKRAALPATAQRMRPEARFDQARWAYRLLGEAVEALGSLPGRRELVLVSDGIAHYAGGRSLWPEMEDVIRRANRSRVTVHSLGATGMSAWPPGAS